MNYNNILNFFNDNCDGALLIYPIADSKIKLRRSLAIHNKFYINLNHKILKIQILQSLEMCPSCSELKKFMIKHGYYVICDDYKIKKLIKNEYEYNEKKFNVFLIIKKEYIKKDCNIL